MSLSTKIEGITEGSQAILDNFFGQYKDAPSRTNLINRIPNEVGINDFCQLTYEHYRFLMNKYQSTDSYVKYIETFFKYLYWVGVLDEQQFRMHFGTKDKIGKQFKRSKNKDTNQIIVQKESDSILAFEQIEKLIEYCNQVEPASDFASYNRLRKAFAFHVMFFQGVSVNGLKDMDIKTYSGGTLILDDRLITVPEKFYSMFEYALENGKAGKYQDLNRSIKKLGEIVGIDNLVPKSITMTSKKYQFACPICGKLYFSFGENWKVVNGKIVCSLCAERLIEKDVKKNVISELDAKDIELVTVDEKEKITHYVSSYDKLKEKLKTPCDFEEWNKYMKLIGDLGEKYVYEREVRKLIASKREDLAECVNADIAKDHNNGYDILSYTETGEELHIEVKATPGTLDTPFYISKNEWDRAMEFKEQGKLYELHRVYNVGKDNIAVRVYTDIQALKRENVLYRVFGSVEEQ